MSKNLRAGLVGLGMMGRHHARVLGSLDGVELVAVSDPMGDPHGVAGGREVLKSVDDLIKIGIDYAMVAAPTAFHEELALKLAQAGVHALIEKPLAVDTPAAEKITAAFKAKGLVGAVGHIERFNPALQQLRKRLDEGELGDVYQITTRRQGPFPARIADVGVIKDLATHDIDSTAWVARSKYVSVSARTAHKSGRVHEDMVAAVCDLENGIITNHLVNWLTPFKERLTIVTGERGAFVADTLTADLTFYANASVATQWDSVAAFRGVSEGDVIRYAFPKPEPLRVEHEAFRDAVLGISGAGERIVTMEQGLATVAVAGAMLESAKRKETIKL
ncbi:MAG: Gfo/Idh/MocA family oxidoreductase [Actinobacteria bacterium]|nr:Gfo/Idh/MocA family oxidoreductase [Actinomycetota bacterium]